MNKCISTKKICTQNFVRIREKDHFHIHSTCAEKECAVYEKGHIAFFI